MKLVSSESAARYAAWGYWLWASHTLTGLWTKAWQLWLRPPGPGRRIPVDDVIKFLMLIAAVYGTYRSARTALRLGAELFG